MRRSILSKKRAQTNHFSLTPVLFVALNNSSALGLPSGLQFKNTLKSRLSDSALIAASGNPIQISINTGLVGLRRVRRLFTVKLELGDIKLLEVLNGVFCLER